jgi:hypothetical protein
MIKKEFEKQQSIALRKQGLTYQEILHKIPVAKSTLSLWLRSVSLAKKQNQTLSQKKILAGKRGGLAKKRQRIERFNNIVSKASNDISKISERELFLIGLTLYWAEGAKEKSHSPGSGFQFGNMDAKMICVVIAWLERVCKIQKSVLVYELYIHKSHKNQLPTVLKYWEKVLDLKRGTITRIYFKTNKTTITNRKNTGESYRGLIRIKVPQSSTLVRQIEGWTEGVYKKICE